MSPPSSPTIKAAEDLELSDSPESETFEDGSDVLADHKETPSRVKTAASMGENGISSSTDQAITSPSSSFRSIPASTSLSSLSPEKLLSRLPSKTSPAGRKLRLASPKPPKNSGSATPTLSGEGFSEVPLTTKNADPEAGEHRTPERKSRAFSLVPPPPADLSYDLPEPVVTPPAKESGPSKASFFSSALGFGFPSTSASLAAEPSSLSAQTSRTASGNSQQGGWKSTMTNLLTTRPASSTSLVPPPSSSRSSPSSHPSAVSPAGPSRTPSSSFLLHRIESTTASRDRRISREAGGGDKLREGFERVRGEMEGAAREMRREREKGVEEEKEERPTSSGGVDWVFWGSVVQDYEEVARTRPKELSKAIQQGIPAVIRGAIWQLMSSSKSLPLEETYKALLKLSSPHEKAIVKDLSRTFPHHKFFQEGGGAGQESLFMVVKAYSLYDQEVGYTQGLAFIVAALLLNMPDEEAFCVLVRLMDSYNLRSHFLADMPGLQLRLFQFDRLLEEILPLIHTHFLRKGIKSSMFASQWFMTLFSYRFPLSLVYRVLDIVFAEGIEAIFRFSLALLQKSEEQLVDLEFEGILNFLQTDLFEVYRAETSPEEEQRAEGEWLANDFVRDAYDVRITPLMLDSYESEWSDLCRDQNKHALELDQLRGANRNLSSQVKQLEASHATISEEHVELVRQLVKSKIEKEETENELVRYKMLYAELAHAQQDAMSTHSRLSAGSLQQPPRFNST